MAELHRSQPARRGGDTRACDTRAYGTRAYDTRAEGDGRGRCDVSHFSRRRRRRGYTPVTTITPATHAAFASRGHGEATAEPRGAACVVRRRL